MKDTVFKDVPGRCVSRKWTCEKGEKAGQNKPLGQKLDLSPDHKSATSLSKGSPM